MRIKIGPAGDLRPGNWLAKRILTRRIAVYNDNGTLYGIEADCAHMKASLTQGHVDNGVVTCSWHGWRYDLATGNCLNQEAFRLKTYRVEIDDDIIYVHI